MLGIRKGFTLVELAIVLVIIGLIMGMAIKGKSLVNVAKIKKDMAQITQYQVATALYFAKKSKLPVRGPIDTCRFDYKSVFADFIPENDFKLKFFDLDIGIFVGRITADGSIHDDCTSANNDLLMLTTVDKSKNVGGSYYTNSNFFNNRVVCTIEVHLDDQSLTAGEGRRIADPETWDSSVYDNCDSISVKKRRYGYILF